jgi:hypothetical protein
MYYIAFPKDRTILRIAVGWVALVGVTQTSLALIDAYRSLISFDKACHGQFRGDGNGMLCFSTLCQCESMDASVIRA